MVKLTFTDRNTYENIKEIFFENNEDLFKYFMNIAQHTLPKIYEDKYDSAESFYFNRFFNKDGSQKKVNFSATLVLNDNPDDYISYHLETISPQKEFKIYKAWSPEVQIFEVFPNNWSKIQKKFREFIAEIAEHEDCMDAYRIGLVDDEESMKEYSDLVSCCGSTDTEYEIDSVKYRFGCNYGH